MISRITPIFPVQSIDDAITFYESIGFVYDFHYHLDGDKTKPKIFAALKWNSQSLYVQISREYSRNGAYLIHEDVRGLQQNLHANGVLTTEPIDHPYSIREMHIEDPWGNELSFAQYLD